MQRPTGRITRGKTAPNRLRQTDTYLAIAHPELVATPAMQFVDLGFGAAPITTVETFDRLRAVNPSVGVIGVDIDPTRVHDAQPFAREGLQFVHAGFELSRVPRPVHVIRAFNVLRQYEEAEVTSAISTLRAGLSDEGIIIDGTCDPLGRLCVFEVYGVDRRRGIVFAPRRRRDTPSGFRPLDLRSVLPKRLIHHAQPGGSVDRFFRRWQVAWQQEGSFIAAARRLAEHGYDVDLRLRVLRRGFLICGPTWPNST